MIQGLRLLGIGAVGLLLGAAASLTVQQVSAAPSARPSPSEHDSAGSMSVATLDARLDRPAATGAPAEAAERVLLAWVPGGLPAGFAAGVAELGPVQDVTEVHGDVVEIVGSRDRDGAAVDVLADGWVIPLDAIALEPSSYAAFVPKSALADFSQLSDGQALLSQTSAQLRRLGAGGSIQLAGGQELIVAAVVQDELIGGAEIAVTGAVGERIGVTTPRYTLLTYQAERAAVEEAIRAGAPSGTPLRLRGPGETPYLRHGDAVLPQAAIKEQFGEFSYRRGSGRDFEQDPAWTEANIVSAQVPILGEVRCHRALIQALEGAMEEVAQLKLAHAVDPAGYAGCWAPRMISSRQSVSRHAWGAAVDLNWPKNPVGQASAQDPRLVEIMQRWGFTWGGHWLIPDPAHFEYAGAPEPAR